MKAVRLLLMTAMSLTSLCWPWQAWAQTSSTPKTVSGTASTVTVVPHSGGSQLNNLQGVPPAVLTLIQSFDRTRDAYFHRQELLQIKLKGATTAEEREQIRQQLQKNRQEFLNALSAFREQLKDELTALKGKIGHEEFLRIINSAYDAATEGGVGHHKGH
jgi:predicted ribosome quality control (RQC) complex YloA/Tae2 family protein